MKKYLGLVLVSCMMLSLVACGGSDNTDNDKGSTTAVTTQATTAPTEAPTVTYKGNTYVVDEAGDWTPQKEVVSDTPTDAAVAPDDVVTGTAPAGGGDFAKRYGW